VALAVVDTDAGGSGGFANEPSPDTICALAGESAVLNVASGFANAFSGFYVSPEAGFVAVYDGLDATGNTLATIVLPAVQQTAPGDPTGEDFGTWASFDVGFSGTARSVLLGGSPGAIGFDDIAFGREGSGDIPEPGTAALFAVGLLGVAIRRRRK
jgi:hypothetical protein